MNTPIRISLTSEQSAALQATGEHAFTVAIRRSYQPPDPATIAQWELHLVPANHRRIVGAMNIIGGTHEARRIKATTTKP